MQNVVPIGSASPQHTARKARRRNLFVAASLLVGDRKIAVRVRNLSETGALLECQVIPTVGEHVILRRGSLQGDGKIVWAAADRAGMAFEQPIDLAQWIPGAAFDDQMEVDRVVARSQANGRTSGARLVPTGQRPTIARIVEELDFVGRRLDSLGDKIAGDPALIARHLSEIQQLDVSVQTLGHLARLLAADCSPEALEAIGMADLRRRLQREDCL